LSGGNTGGFTAFSGQVCLPPSSGTQVCPGATVINPGKPGGMVIPSVQACVGDSVRVCAGVDSKGNAGLSIGINK